MRTKKRGKSHVLAARKSPGLLNTMPEAMLRACRQARQAPCSPGAPGKPRVCN